MKWIFVLALAGALCAPVSAEPTAELPATPQQVQPLLIGSRAPGGVWPDATGADFDLQVAMDGRPTIMVFYRAHW
ncbi:MAG: hypothetical protein HN712_02020 [Gemmatimonadetes bacterium]|jgi:hypothetical protein|nr:hypothetical protein [Gemmatimonadota bacterium]MBT7859051.1 hypothetical protein [Gemmatimonadota bacterium]